MESSLIWLNREPRYKNYRVHPGLRHPSRIHTIPAAYRRTAESSNQCQLRVLRNSKTAQPQLLLLLNEAKNLFVRQLPNMGSEYVTRSVFDFNAETVLVLHRGVVTGAVCSRLFPIELFIEVVFLAVDSKYQSKGYGRLVMNYLKSCIQVYQFYDIIACADNDAVAFFKKLGFNEKSINMDPARWVKRIKDYEGVTLVHCKIHKDVDYLKFSETIKKQIDFVENIIGKHFIDTPEKIKEPYKRFPEAPTFVSIPMHKVRRLVTNKLLDSDEDMAKTENYKERMEKLRKQLSEILDKLENEPKFKDVFTRPVTEVIAPKYFETIKRPMDFLTIRRRLERFPDYYKRPEMFFADMQLIIDNCKTFNPSGTIYFSLATSLGSQFRSIYNDMFPTNSM
jgi:histone acetyltransferase